MDRYGDVKNKIYIEFEITPEMVEAGAEAMALDCRLEIDYKTASLSAIEAALNASGKFTTVKTSPLIKC